MFLSKRVAKLVIYIYITKFFYKNIAFLYEYCLENE